jgi:hypothetical protein
VSAIEATPLPEDGKATIDGVQLPSGRRLRGNPEFAPVGAAPVEGPVLWATDGKVPARTLLQLRETPARGLVPLLLSGMEDDPKRPWDSREFCPTDPGRVDALSAVDVLAQGWRESVGEEKEPPASVAPYGMDFPGLAAAPASGNKDPFAQGEILARIRPARLALVAAPRPADAVAALGWMGAVNVHEDPAVISAVLRSWEDRWAATLIQIGFDMLTLTVGNPPRSERTALGLAAEHFALCPDNVWQGTAGVETIRAYAGTLVNSRIWSFWWD